jgi:hypothetical protein
MKAKAARRIQSDDNNTRITIPIMFLDLNEAPAQSVCIAGTFNDWQPGRTWMIHLGGGCWARELALPPGRYEYRLVVDGEWIPDPLAEDYVQNAFGGINSVLTIPCGVSWAA